MLFLIRVKVSSNEYVPVGHVLTWQGVVEGDFGPGNWKKLTTSPDDRDAALFRSKAGAERAVKKFWHVGADVKIQIIRLQEMPSESIDEVLG